MLGVLDGEDVVLSFAEADNIALAADGCEEVLGLLLTDGKLLG